MPLHRRIRRGLLCGLIPLLVTMAAPVRGVGGTEWIPVRIGMLPLLSAAPLLAAQDQGYFAEEGIEVVLRVYHSHGELAQALLQGELDGAIVDVVPAIQAIEEGAPLRIVSTVAAAYGLYSAPDIGITDLEEVSRQLVGLGLGLQEGGSSAYMAEQFFMRAGIATAGVEIIDIPDPELRLDRLLTGGIDIAVLPQPLGGIAESRNGVSLIDSSMVNEASDVFVFSERALLQGEQIGRLLRAYNRAVSATPDVWMPLLTEELGCCTEELSSLLEYQFPAARVPQREFLSRIGFWMFEQGMLQHVLMYENLIGLLPTRFLRE